MLPVNFVIVKTHLLSRKRQTVVAMLGVMFGIGMFILLVSFMKGMNNFFENLLLSVTPDIHMYNDIEADYNKSAAAMYYSHTPELLVMLLHPKPKKVNTNISNASAIVHDLKTRNDIEAVSALVSSNILFNYGPTQVGAVIDGVNIIEEAKVFDLDRKMRIGQPRDLLTADNGIILGYKLANKLNLTVGDFVTATSPSGVQMRFRMVGAFQFGISTVDEVKAYVSVSALQQFLGKSSNHITDIRVKLKDMKLAPELSRYFNRKYDLKSEDWETVNASIRAGNFIRDVFTNVLTFTLLLVAGFGIYNIMNMIISGKMKDIAILKAQGFSKKDILQIFLFQSLVVGIIGAAAGVVLGFGSSYLLSTVPWPEDEAIVITHFPVTFELKYYLLGALYGVLTTALAGLMPALKASKTDPVTILRG
jgi:lipoprotein-releasing system permease protein